jgi:hypothetical protein
MISFYLNYLFKGYIFKHSYVLKKQGPGPQYTNLGWGTQFRTWPKKMTWLLRHKGTKYKELRNQGCPSPRSGSTELFVIFLHPGAGRGMLDLTRALRGEKETG